MGYDYQTQRPGIFTEDGQIMFLKIRDNAKRLIKEAGAVTAEKLMGKITGDSWTMLACMDRLIEIGELHEIPNTKSRAGQHRIFTSFDWA
jgi:roadblock/LC7 domain-containing protein